MVRSVWKYLFLVATVSVFSYSCIKKKTYPSTPEISYKDFILYPGNGDTASLVIKFTDGDGDIGVGSNDSTQNLFYTYYYFDESTQTFRAVYSSQLNDTVRVGYVMRAPTDAYKGKPISGELSIMLQSYRFSKTHKRIKYVVVLADNAGHKSAPMTTDEINVP